MVHGVAHYSSIADTMDQLYTDGFDGKSIRQIRMSSGIFLSAMQRFNLNVYYYGVERGVGGDGGGKGQNRSSRVNVIAPGRVHVVYVGREIYRVITHHAGFILDATRETIIAGSNTTPGKKN